MCEKAQGSRNDPISAGAGFWSGSATLAARTRASAKPALLAASLVASIAGDPSEPAEYIWHSFRAPIAGPRPYITFATPLLRKPNRTVCSVPTEKVWLSSAILTQSPLDAFEAESCTVGIERDAPSALRTASSASPPLTFPPPQPAITAPTMADRQPPIRDIVLELFAMGE